MNDNKNESGAVRSADVDALDFMSLPLLGLFGAARTAGEGGTKYGRFNYMLGMPIHETLNHAFAHILMFACGDRSEPHLEHATWNLMAAVQTYAMDPQSCAEHLLGPGMTLTQEIKDRLARDRDELARRRASGEFDGLSGWDIEFIPQVKRILEERNWFLGYDQAPPKPTATKEIVALSDDGELAYDTNAGLNEKPCPPGIHKPAYLGWTFSSSSAHDLAEQGIWVKNGGYYRRNFKDDQGNKWGEYRADGEYPDCVRVCHPHSLDGFLNIAGNGWFICEDGNDPEAVARALGELGLT